MYCVSFTPYSINCIVCSVHCTRYTVCTIQIHCKVYSSLKWKYVIGTSNHKINAEAISLDVMSMTTFEKADKYFRNFYILISFV